MYQASTKLLGTLARPAERLPGGRSRLLRGAALGARLTDVGLIVAIGLIHLHLWLEGYRLIPTNGPLFLVDAIAAFVLAAALLLWPRPVVGLLGLGLVASTLGALLISLSVGLFGFQESIGASYVMLSIVLEAVALAGLVTWMVVARGGSGRTAP